MKPSWKQTLYAYKYSLLDDCLVIDAKHTSQMRLKEIAGKFWFCPESVKKKFTYEKFFHNKNSTSLVLSSGQQLHYGDIKSRNIVYLAFLSYYF